MTFGFTRRRGVKDQVRRIAVEQVESALAECAGEGDFDKTVHGLRRRCKKLRGLLRLIEPQFKSFELENQVLRDAAQGLAGSRDAAVMVQTFDALSDLDQKRDGGPCLDSELTRQLQGVLRRRVIHGPEMPDRHQFLGGFAGAIAPLGERAGSWRIEGRDFACLGAGLERTYKRLRDGIDQAHQEVSAEALHDWRKHAKYHWHHMSLLQRSAPELVHGRRDTLNVLTELLGDHHNLHVLHAWLSTDMEQVPVEGLEALGGLIAERQRTLEERAFDLGRQLTAEKPGVLRRRFEQYWQLLPEVE